jgi:hypothetical protein
MVKFCYTLYITTFDPEKIDLRYLLWGKPWTRVIYMGDLWYILDGENWVVYGGFIETYRGVILTFFPVSADDFYRQKTFADVFIVRKHLLTFFPVGADVFYRQKTFAVVFIVRANLLTLFIVSAEHKL